MGRIAGMVLVGLRNVSKFWADGGSPKTSPIAGRGREHGGPNLLEESGEYFELLAGLMPFRVCSPSVGSDLGSVIKSARIGRVQGPMICAYCTGQKLGSSDSFEFGGIVDREVLAL